MDQCFTPMEMMTLMARLSQPLAEQLRLGSVVSDNGHPHGGHVCIAWGAQRAADVFSFNCDQVARGVHFVCVCLPGLVATLTPARCLDGDPGKSQSLSLRILHVYAYRLCAGAHTAKRIGKNPDLSPKDDLPHEDGQPVTGVVLTTRHNHGDGEREETRED